MKRLFIATDIEARTKKDIRLLRKLIKQNDPDIAIILGDYFDPSLFDRCSNIHDIESLYLNLLDEFSGYNIPVIINPGNKDLRMFDTISASYPALIYPRLKPQVVKGLKVCAIPGSQEAIGDPRFFYVLSLDFISSHLISFTSLQNLDILVTHKGPKTYSFEHVYGNGVDFACFREVVSNGIVPVAPTNHAASKGNLGSKGLRVLYETFHPKIGVCGHFHEGRGVDRIEESVVINPGSFCNNLYNTKNNYAIVVFKEGVREIALCNFEGRQKIDLIP